ncbi:MAG: response regulator [Elusimicrobia bacterium]|nr:response regulator [Elusimicrobiota bacterium]
MSYRILLADDSPGITEALTDILEARGYEIASVGDGMKLIEKAKEWLPHLIIADLMMPGTYGSTACKALQADPKTAHIPVIFLTAVEEAKARRLIPDSLHARLLTKPMDVTHLLTAITEFLPPL